MILDEYLMDFGGMLKVPFIGMQQTEQDGGRLRGEGDTVAGFDLVL